MINVTTLNAVGQMFNRVGVVEYKETWSCSSISHKY